MKKVIVLATAAFLVTGFAFASGGEKDKKKTEKEGTKACCKGSKECSKDEKKETKTTAKTATKKA